MRFKWNEFVPVLLLTVSGSARPPTPGAPGGFMKENSSG